MNPYVTPVAFGFTDTGAVREFKISENNQCKNP